MDANESLVVPINNPDGDDANTVALRWKDVKFSVQQPKGGSKEILKGISGHSRTGTILAIMGASGAGKTSLLNILSQRVASTKKSTVSGEFFLNNSRFSSKTFKRHAAYIMQEDVLMETLTPREIFDFSAKLRLPRSTTEVGRKAAVDKTLNNLKLDKCSDTRVGGIFIRGISGGERKRVSIGMEIITDPKVLFVDEPTSGLDSFTAERVVILLKELAKEGRTVITTIHQPSSDIFALFDDLLLLSAGKVIYFGKASNAVSYFSKIGYPCPQYSNPADYFMKIMQPGTSEDDSRLQHLITSYKEFEKSDGSSKVTEIEEAPHSELDHISWFSGLVILTMRALKNFIRQPMLTRVRFAESVFLGLLTGVLFFQVSNSQTSIQDRNGGLFFVAINNAMTAIMTTVLSFPPEKAIFLRERANNTYSTAMYYWGKTIAELPFQFIFPLVNASISYFMMGLRNEPDRFLVFLVTATLLGLSGQSYGLMTGCAISDANVAVAITPVTVIPLMLFAGFFANSDSLPAPFKVLQYISPFYYGFNAFAINEYKGLELMCEEGEFINFGSTRQCPITSGEKVLANLSIDDEILFNIGMLALLTVVIRLLGYVVLKVKTKSIY